MADANPGVAAKAGTIPLSVDSQDHGHSHGHSHSHSHADHDHAAQGAATRDAAIAIPRSYRSSMFLASAVERLVIAVLLIGLIWVGIIWAVS